MREGEGGVACKRDGLSTTFSWTHSIRYSKFLAITTSPGGQIPRLLITVCILNHPHPPSFANLAGVCSLQAWDGWEKTQLHSSSVVGRRI